MPQFLIEFDEDDGTNDKALATFQKNFNSRMTTVNITFRTPGSVDGVEMALVYVSVGIVDELN